MLLSLSVAFSRLCGSLGYYDATREKKISLKLPQPLQVYDRIFHKVTTTDDPIIREVIDSCICCICRPAFMFMYEVIR